MSLCSKLLVVVAVAFGCAADSKTSDEPTTAREKQRREAKRKGEDDGAPKSWGRWRYKGDRDNCFFEVDGKCFKTENAACQAARCKKPARCVTTGAGPAQVSCEKK